MIRIRVQVQIIKRIRARDQIIKRVRIQDQTIIWIQIQAQTLIRIQIQSNPDHGATKIDPDSDLKVLGIRIRAPTIKIDP